jgi:hypothetical protein
LPIFSPEKGRQRHPDLIQPIAYISLIAPSDVTIDRHIPTIHENPALPRQITHSTAPEFNGSGIRNSTYVNKRYKKDAKTLFCLDASV